MRQRDSSGRQLPGLGHVHAAGERQVQKRLAEVHRRRGRKSAKGKVDWGRIDGSIAHSVPYCGVHRNTDAYSDANCHGHRRPICYRHLDLDFRLNRERDLDSHRTRHANANFKSDRLADAYNDRDRNSVRELDQGRVDDANCHEIRDRNRVDDGNRDQIRNCNFDPESDANRNRDAHANRDFNRVGDADRDRHSHLQRNLRDFVEFQR
jgi:hypothetical protein